MKREIPTIIINDTRVDRHHGCTRVMDALEFLLAKHGCHVVARVPAHTSWEMHPDVAAHADMARLIVVNGEGTIHHDRPAGKRLLCVGPWARQRGIPAVLLNAGWEANGQEAVDSLSEFSLVAVRDHGSASEIRRLGGDCRVVPDLSLYLPWASDDSRRSGMAFTDNVDREATLRLDAARRAMGASWLPIQQSARGIAERVAFVRNGVARADLRKPHLAWGMIRVRSLLSAARLASPGQFLQELSRLQLLVTGRFHACTLAMLARTPFVSLPSNTGKIQALVQDAGLSSWRCASDLSPSSLAEAMHTGWEANEQASLEDYIEAGRRAADALMHDIRCLA